MNRSLVIVILVAVLVSPALVLAGQATPAPHPAGSPIASPTIGVPVPTRAARAVRPSTPEPGPAEQPGLFASGPELTQRSPAGPFLRGDDDQLAVVGVYPDDSGNAVLVALRNNTDSDRRGVEIVATLSGAAGGIVALGVTTTIVPAVVVPGGLGFALIQVEGAAGTIDADNLPRIAVSEPDRGGAPPVVDLRLVLATVTPADVLTAVVADFAETDTVSSVQTIAVCVRLARPNALAVGGWSSGETVFEVPLREGDGTTIRIDAPPGCGDQFIVAVAGR